MDCEKFDQHVIEALYDELDELTHAALKRHVEGCSRCATVWAGLRATREVGVLPLEEPPDDLEARILDAAASAQRRAPWPKKVLRGLAWAGSHAMRPQLAMAALFFLVIGSSLLLLRARPGTLGPVSVTERGSPAPEPSEMAAAAPPALATATAVMAPAASAAAEPPAQSLVAAAEGKSAGSAAPPAATAAPGRGGADDARAALAEARTTRDGAGCAAAVPKLDAVAVAFAGTQTAADAMWDEASCYRQMGEAQKAQQLYLALRSTGYRDRAEAQLAAADGNSNMRGQLAGRAAAGASPPVAAAAPAYRPSDADEQRGGGAGSRAPAAKAKRPAGDVNPHAPAAPAPRTNAGFSP